MSNTIALRVYDFLKAFPPFSLLAAQVLQDIAAQVLVQYRRPGEVLFRQGEAPGAYLYVVREGAVRLVHEDGGERVLVDRCDEGDLFGLRPLLAERAYELTAEAEEESLIYALPTEGWRELLDENPRVAVYLAGAFASDNRLGFGLHPSPQRIEPAAADSLDLLEVQAIEARRAPVTCGPHRTIADAAATMSREEVGSIIVVDDQERPIGIVTDKDLRITDSGLRSLRCGLIQLEPDFTRITGRRHQFVENNRVFADARFELKQ